MDYSSGTIIANVKNAHAGASVSCVKFDGVGLNLVSTGHDGSLSIWDLRKVHTGKVTLMDNVDSAHLKKHQEGAMCLVIHTSLPLIVSGGSDGFVKVFEIIQSK